MVPPVSVYRHARALPSLSVFLPRRRVVVREVIFNVSFASSPPGPVAISVSSTTVGRPAPWLLQAIDGRWRGITIAGAWAWAQPAGASRTFAFRVVPERWESSIVSALSASSRAARGGRGWRVYSTRRLACIVDARPSRNCFHRYWQRSVADGYGGVEITQALCCKPVSEPPTCMLKQCSIRKSPIEVEIVHEMCVCCLLLIVIRLI